jgi:hypothetical protein
MPLAKFMAGPIGRGARVVVGIVLMAIGAFALSGAGEAVLIVVGAVVFLAGALNFCLVGPIVGASLSGRKVLKSS